MLCGEGHGDQLQLVFEGEEIVRVPWDGRSPRALTRVGLSLIFKAQAAKSTSDFSIDPDQYDLFGDAKTGPPRYEGAPSLLPLPRRI